MRHPAYSGGKAVLQALLRPPFRVRTRGAWHSCRLSVSSLWARRGRRRGSYALRCSFCSLSSASRTASSAPSLYRCPALLLYSQTACTTFKPVCMNNTPTRLCLNGSQDMLITWKSCHAQSTSAMLCKSLSQCQCLFVVHEPLYAVWVRCCAHTWHTISVTVLSYEATM